MNLTREESDLIEKFILLPVTRKALEADRRAIDASGLKFREQYLAIIDNTNIALQKEMRDVRKAVIDQKIKPIRIDDLHYEVIVRGYKHSVGYHPNFARGKINEMLNKFGGLPI